MACGPTDHLTHSLASFFVQQRAVNLTLHQLN